jgi:transposase InsO family protein
MRQEGIYAKMKRRFKVTTRTTASQPVAENLVRKEFAAERMNQLWTSDMTYVWTREGWLYLAVVLDVYSRRIVGYAMSNRLTAALVMGALEQALMHRAVRDGLVFHSDRGSQYASMDVRQILKFNNIRQSMSSTGSCYDNAITETFFHTLKTELTYWERYQTRDEARRNIFEYIEVFYNRQRLHSALGYKPPVEFEQQLT